MNPFLSKAFVLILFGVLVGACGEGGGGNGDPTVTPEATRIVVSPTPGNVIGPSPTAAPVQSKPDDPTPTPTEQAVTQTPVATATPTAEASPTPEARPELPEVDIEKIIIPSCRTNPFVDGSAGFGTVPRAPSTDDQGSSETPVVRMIEAMAPISQWVGFFTSASDESWDAAVTDQDFARSLVEESRRLWLACGAIANSTTVEDLAHPFMININSNLTARHEWLVDRLEVLREDPERVRDADEERRSVSETLTGTGDELQVLADSQGVPGAATLSGFEVPNPLLEISLELDGGWLVLRNRIDIVALAPTGDQALGIDGLGVPGWNLGTALRVRRFRHDEPWTLTDTAGLVDSLSTRFGDREGSEPLEINGLDSVLRTYREPEYRWTTLVAATARDAHSYLFELGCPTEDEAQCHDRLQQIVSGTLFIEQ